MCAIVAENNFGLRLLKGSTEVSTGNLGRSPSLPAVYLPFPVHCFGVFDFGKMPGVRAVQRVGRKSRIKGGRHT